MSENLSEFKLAPGEMDVFRETFSKSFLLSYLKTELICSSTRFVCTIPNTILGIIPFGSYVDEYPMHQIIGVSSRRQVSIVRFILGISLLIAGAVLVFGGFHDWTFLGIPFSSVGLLSIPIGVIFLATSFSSIIVIRMIDGDSLKIKVSSNEYSKVEEFRTELKDRIFADRSQTRHEEAQMLRLLQAQIQQQQLLINNQELKDKGIDG